MSDPHHTTTVGERPESAVESAPGGPSRWLDQVTVRVPPSDHVRIVAVEEAPEVVIVESGALEITVPVVVERRSELYEPGHGFGFVITADSQNGQEPQTWTMECARGDRCTWSRRLTAADIADALALAAQHVQERHDQPWKAPDKVQRILAAASELSRFSVEQITGHNRRREIVAVRQIAMYVTRNTTDMSYPEIGRAFGGRDHTTVLHAVKKIEQDMAERTDIFDRVQDLQRRVAAHSPLTR